MRIHNLLMIAAMAVLVSGCGSSGGASTPPAPPAPVTPPPPPPPPPPPEPMFDERLADLAAFDPNPCRARTPGFEALGGWLKNDGRELGGSRVWIDDVRGVGSTAVRVPRSARMGELHGLCGSIHGRSLSQQRSVALGVRSRRWRRRDRFDFVGPRVGGYRNCRNRGVWSEYPHVRAGVLDVENDGNRDGQRLLRLAAAGNDNGKRTSHLQRAGFQLALQESATALVILIGGYVGEGDDRAPAADIATTSGGMTGSSFCDDAAPLCLFAPWRGGGPRRHRHQGRDVARHPPGGRRSRHRLDRLAGHGCTGSPQSGFRLCGEYGCARRRDRGHAQLFLFQRPQLHQ